MNNWPMDIEHIFFDLGDTLVDTSPIPASMQYILSQFPEFQEVDVPGFALQWIESISGRLYRSQHGGEFLSMRQIFFSQFKATASRYRVDIEQNELEQMNNAVIEHAITQFQLYPDTIGTLEFFRNKNIELGMITDGDADITYPILERLGLEKYFGTIIISSEFNAYKPASVLFSTAISSTGRAPARSVFVGDTSEDIVGGSQAGMRTILMSRSRSPDRLKATGSDMVVHSLRELRRLFGDGDDPAL